MSIPSRVVAAKRVVFCLLTLLLCVLTACESADLASSPSPSAAPSLMPSVAPSVEPSVEPSPTPTPTKKPSPTPTPEPRVELLSYEEYFSEEREIELPFPNDDDDDPFTTADGDWHSVVRKKDGFVVAEGTTGRYATVVDKDGYYREVAFAKDNKLYITEDNGETPIVVYEATEQLRPIFFADDPISGVVLGFRDGTRRYRLYVPTRTVDFMFDLPDVKFWEERTENPSEYNAFIYGEVLATNRTWVCAVDGTERWGRACADAMGYDYEKSEFDSRVPLWYDSVTGKWHTWGRDFDWAMDVAGIPKELREYE